MSVPIPNNVRTRAEEGNGAWPWLVKALVAALMMFGVVYLWRASITAAPGWVMAA